MRTNRCPPAHNLWSALCCAAICACAEQAAATERAETEARAQIAAATLEDAVVVDCQLPGRLQQLGGMRTYLTPGVLTRLSAIDCRTRGGEYTVGDLASGTLSLNRWLPLADQGNLEAQYYVARIYANGMNGVPVDYAKAAQWYRRAADKKYPPAMQELGYLYEQGLGVQRDELVGLNLQREASGLGDDLDYSWKLAATKDEAAKQIAALTDQLGAANTDVEDLRSQLRQANDRLIQSSAELQQAQNRQLDLRSQLALAKRADSGESAAHIKQLQDQLAANEQELHKRQDTISALSASLATRQSDLSAQLAKSQATNSQLNEMLASGQNENQALRARLAQSEQRFIQSQQELSSLRSDYLKETEALAARSEELQLIRARGNDNGAALLAAKQQEIDRQQLQVKSLESQLAELHQQAATAGSGTADAMARNKALEASLAALQAQYTEQQRQLQAQRAQFAGLQSQTKDDRAALLRQMTDQLSVKTLELEDKQRRDAYNRDRDQRGQEAAAAADDVQRGREALRLAQEKISEQRDKLEQLEMESAAQQLKLVQQREDFAQQQAAGQRGSQQKIAALEAEVRDKGLQISAARERIAALEQSLSASQPPPPVVANNVSFRMLQPGDKAAGDKAAGDRAASNPSTLLDLVRGMGPANYHALIIGNSNYRYMGGLITPSSDARAIAKLLEGRYGFDVKLLIDATRDQIMQAMNEYARTMTDADRLLIYYAGHGGTKFGPPERAFWLGVDADPELLSSWLSAQTISDAIWQIHARHILLVADSCFSSVITHPTSTTVSRAADERRTKIEWSRAARMVLTSGQNEPVVDATSADRVHSLFADLFITVLRQNDILMSGEMLAHEVSSRMAAESPRTGLKQTPTYSNLQDPNHKFGDFFFVPVASGIQVASIMP
jgi:hypothetical protein